MSLYLPIWFDAWSPLKFAGLKKNVSKITIEWFTLGDNRVE